MRFNRFYIRLGLAGAFFFIALGFFVLSFAAGGLTSAAAMGLQQGTIDTTTPGVRTPQAYLPVVLREAPLVVSPTPTEMVTPTVMVTPLASASVAP